MNEAMILTRNQKYTVIGCAIGLCVASYPLFLALPFFWCWVMKQPEADDPGDRE